MKKADIAHAIETVLQGGKSRALRKKHENTI
jgi:hypothetical protein